MTHVLVGRSALEPPTDGSAITIGTFDGVHLGHRALIKRAQDEAERLGASSVIVTWDRHPSETLRPERTPPLLTSSDRKMELLVATGVDVVVVLPFDQDLAGLPPEAFVSEVLVAGLAARAVVVGHDWRFGHKAAGDVNLLSALGAEAGFSVDGVELQEVAGAPVSSSRTRAAVSEGRMELARDLLGRPFDVDGLVKRGAGRGRTLGFPTANLEVDPRLALPPRGVYAAAAEVAGLFKPAAVNIGVNPTFGGEEGVTPLSVEAYVLDLAQDLYESTLRLRFWQRLRDEQRFDSVEELVARIASDVEDTRAIVTGDLLR